MGEKLFGLLERSACRAGSRLHGIRGAGLSQSNVIVQQVLEIQPFGTVLVWAARPAPFFILSGVFTFFYKLIPNTAVRFGPPLVGGITAAVLWGIAGKAFTKFVAESAKYSANYSSFAVLILFLPWLYALRLIVLFGAQVSFILQHPTAYLSRLLWEQGTLAFRERLALRVLLVLAQRYLKWARSLNQPELAIELNLSPSLVEEQVEHLVGRRLIGVIAEPEGLSLIKPPELISVTEVLDATREGDAAEFLAPLEADDAISSVLHLRDKAVENALGGITLRSLAMERTQDLAGQEYSTRA